jgi:hypothetical protein
MNKSDNSASLSMVRLNLNETCVSSVKSMLRLCKSRSLDHQMR